MTRASSPPWLAPTPEVGQALADGRPVVALESTIITHGMPWPTNAETARRVEAVVREHGATPATIAVMDGRIRVGLDDAQLEALARGEGAHKLSRRDLGTALAQGWRGGTTVAATMICAERAGIAVFATGGIGGVHRGGEHSLDVSADLHELGRTPVAVVSAGCKAILDIPRTLEVLETQGVPVIGYGCDEVPAFYTRHSGCAAPLRLDTPAQVAAAMHAQWSLGLRTGLLVANPIPEADAMPREEIEAAIEAALADADARGITGKDVTPFLLARVVERTGERSLRANVALVLDNARVAAAIATAYAERQAK
ncbi:MAG: pseudouridine-5'-phosphate glycosidase [Myxococcales bacterium]|nr:pseudouridine-5'-phosphate glycosidase [Myxococcales bacterium]MCB9717487.1 pseudouridine-5'-phosphate glycosidase [Myxococcales bacterium]